MLLGTCCHAIAIRELVYEFPTQHIQPKKWSYMIGLPLRQPRLFGNLHLLGCRCCCCLLLLLDCLDKSLRDDEGEDEGSICRHFYRSTVHLDLAPTSVQDGDDCEEFSAEDFTEAVEVKKRGGCWRVGVRRRLEVIKVKMR